MATGAFQTATCTADDRELISYVLSSATECLCLSLDPAQVVRRLISTHHLTDDDKREINQFARMDEKVDKLLEIMKMQDKAAYDAFLKALDDFHRDLYKDVFRFECDYHDGARPKVRPKKEGDQKGGKGQARGSQQNNTFNTGDTHNKTYNTSQSKHNTSNVTVIGKCVNIHGDQTIVGGNVYNVKGDCTVIGGKFYPGGKPKPFKFTSTKPPPKYTYDNGPGTHYSNTTYTRTEYNFKPEPKTDPKDDQTDPKE